MDETEIKIIEMLNRLEVYTKKHPEIRDCYTVGDPSVAIKKI